MHKFIRDLLKKIVCMLQLPRHLASAVLPLYYYVKFVPLQILLLLGQYCEETASQESNTILKLYRDVVKVHEEWEDGYFYLASYYDKILCKVFDQSTQHKKG